MTAVSPEAKKKLAEYLRKTDPDMLEFFTLAGKAFGKAKVVYYERKS